jgi:hypothetical protein
MWHPFLLLVLFSGLSSLEAKETSDTPRNFRIHLVGENQMLMASGQVLPSDMSWIFQTLRKKKPEYKRLFVLDLRQEAHGFKGEKTIVFSKPWTEESALVREKKMDATEEAFWKKAQPKDGTLSYRRFPIVDHEQAPDEMVDEWVHFLGDLDPRRDVVHVHCAAGKGRTSQFLVLSHLYFAENPNLEEALSSVRSAGGSDFFTAKRKGDKKRQEAFFKRQVFLKELGTYFSLPKKGRPSFVLWKKARQEPQLAVSPLPDGNTQ